jgi:hypothetical protein
MKRGLTGVDSDGGLLLHQDLHLVGPVSAGGALRDAAARREAAPWRHAVEREAEVRLGSKDDAIAWERTDNGGLPSAGLLLWAGDRGYRVVNIVPLETSELTIQQYNAILAEFVALIAAPAAAEAGFDVEMSGGRQTLEDWVSPRAAHALRTFALTANRATGSSHPVDRRRWIQFLLADRARDLMGAERLERWLVEVADFGEEVAGRLVSQYEFARDLLEADRG